MDEGKILNYLIDLNNQHELFDYYNNILKFDNVHFIPAVRFDCAIYLYQSALIKQPKNSLEIGFGSGASALFIHKGLNKDCKFTTLERDINRYNRGQKLFKEYNIDNINLLHAESFDYLEESKETFDYIFLDAQKKDYIIYLPILKEKLNKNGLLLVDNIIFSGKVVEDNLPKKYINGVKHLKAFNTTLSNDKELNTLFCNIGDGLSISVKK